MIEQQTELQMFESAPTDGNVEWLERLLKARAEWMTAVEVCRAAGRAESDDQKRYVRQLASASQWILSGQSGYRHITQATAEEINHAANWLESQAKKMADRACRLRRNAHRIVS